MRALTYDDISLVPFFSEIPHRDDIDISTDIGLAEFLEIPILSAGMDTVTDVKVAKLMSCNGGVGILPRFKNIEARVTDATAVHIGGHRVIASVGVIDPLPEVERLHKICDAISIDVAHADHQMVCDSVRMIRRNYPYLPLIVGNVVTAGGADRLWDAGATAVRVGIGSGSIGTTRVETGFGVPQITALENVATQRDISYDDRFVIADGGIRSPGDVVKALAVGADAVILGNAIARSCDAPGNNVVLDGIEYKEYNGATSAVEKTRQGKPSRYIEGVEALVPSDGTIRQIMSRYADGIRSGLSYVGARNLDEFRERVMYVEITNAGSVEGRPHDVRLV